MSSNNKDLIFDEWKASLKQRDRSAPAVANNFEELFNELKRANISFDEAHSILPKAIKAHLPGAALAKHIYKSSKTQPKYAGMSEKEFVDKWNDGIADTATSTFFEIYPRAKVDTDDDGEPKIYGQMSAKEYKAQRRYADSFPRLNTELLEQTMVSNTYNPLDDIENILGKKEDGQPE